MRSWFHASMFVTAAALTGCGLGASLDEYTAGVQGGAGGSQAAGAGGAGAGVDASLDSASDAKGGAGGSVPDAAAEASTWPGASCSAPGTYACAGPAQQVVVACKNGSWEHALDCAGTKLCDSTLAPTVSDRCAEQVPICAGQQPGAYVCDGAKLTHCGPDLVTATSDDCGSAQLCALHVGATCAACVDGEHQCSGATLKGCAADHLSWTTVTTCASAALCNAGAGQCTSATCVAGQHRCTGADLEVCNGAQTGFDKVQTCASASLCDAPSGVCDVCVGGTTSCGDATHMKSCAADGSGWTSTACPTNAPTCVGAGQCVGCASTADCPPPSGPCKVATCTAGVCGTQVTSGAACDDGNACTSGDKCDGSGACTASTLTACTALDACHSAGTCDPSTGVCSNPVKTGAACDDGNTCTSGDQCDASGACAGTVYTCNAPPDPCHTSPGTCDGNGGCSYAAKPAGSACTGSSACHNYTCTAGGACMDQGTKWNGTKCGDCMVCDTGVCMPKCTGLQTCKCGDDVCRGPTQQCP